MRRILFVVLVVSVVLLFFPGKYKDREFNESCKDYCQSTLAKGLAKALISLDCDTPLDGFSAGCLGVTKKYKCESTNKCYSWCDNICYGLVVGTGAAPGSTEAKIEFIKGLFRN